MNTYLETPGEAIISTGKFTIVTLMIFTVFYFLISWGSFEEDVMLRNYSTFEITRVILFMGTFVFFLSLLQDGMRGGTLRQLITIFLGAAMTIQEISQTMLITFGILLAISLIFGKEEKKVKITFNLFLVLEFFVIYVALYAFEYLTR